MVLKISQKKIIMHSFVNSLKHFVVCFVSADYKMIKINDKPFINYEEN